MSGGLVGAFVSHVISQRWHESPGHQAPADL